MIASFVILNTVRSWVWTTGPLYTLPSSVKIRDMIWGESSACQRPAIRGFTSLNTLPAAFGEVWVALMIIVACSMEILEEAVSALAGGKPSWISRSTPPLQARTSDQDGRVSPDKQNDRPAKSRR